MLQKSATLILPVNEKAAFAHVLAAPVPSASNAAPLTGSILNEKRLREHEDMIKRDPNYDMNKKRWFGVPSHPSVQRSVSSVQKFDQFISKQ